MPSCLILKFWCQFFLDKILHVILWVILFYHISPVYIFQKDHLNLWLLILSFSKSSSNRGKHFYQNNGIVGKHSICEGVKYMQWNIWWLISTDVNLGEHILYSVHVYDQFKAWLFLFFRRALDVSSLLNLEQGNVHRHHLFLFLLSFQQTHPPNPMPSGGAVAYDIMSPSVFLLFLVTVPLLAHSAPSNPLGTYTFLSWTSFNSSTLILFIWLYIFIHYV